MSNMTTLNDNINLSSYSEEEIQAQELVKNGQIDQALSIYQQLKPDSSRILNIIGVLYAEKKQDFITAIEYYQKALEIQQKNDEDTSNTLIELGIAHQNLHQYDLALEYHSFALIKQKLAHNIDKRLIANSFIGIANAYWGKKNFSQALNYAQQALILNESIQSNNNNSHIAANLAVLANIYYNIGDSNQALYIAKRAINLLEYSVPNDLCTLATLFNNIGVIQFNVGLLKEAQLSFIKALKIYESIHPEGHLKRIQMENNIQRIAQMEHDGGTPNRRRESVTRFQIPSGIGINQTSIRSSLPIVHSIDELISDDKYSFINNDYENILFIFLDLYSQLTSHLIGSLRTINDDIQIYTDIITCLDVLRTSKNRIFFISSSDDKQLIEEIHNIHKIEAIFIFNSHGQIDNRFPKLYGIYAHFEELLTALKDTLEWFERTQIELFVFERERIFLWSQLWKEEFIKVKKPKIISTKENLVYMAENYYRGNIKLHQLINDFNQFYTKNDALQWCFISPFPSRLLRRTLHSYNTDILNICQFLLIDISRLIQQQSNKKSSCELYKGMKMTNEYLDKLANYTGKLICTKGFLLCNQSRKTALAIANSPDHRPDLMPVLFKITYNTSIPIAELPVKDTASLIIFDIYTVFRVKYVNRGSVSIVKIEPADEDGRSLALEYRMKYKSESIENLLNQLLIPSKPPTKLPSLQKRPLPLSVSPDLSTNEVSLSVIYDNEEMQAQELAKNGQIDEAITIYQQIKPESARVFKAIGVLYAEKKGDYDSAIVYYKKALKIEEKKSEDVSDTLSRLGIVHQNRHEYDLAIACHTRALNIRKKASLVDQILVANSLIGIANAYWGQQNLTEALNYAQQALKLNDSFESGNDLNIAANLAILANIHYNSGDANQALEIATRALSLLERCVPSDSLTLASLINNIATIQVATGSFTDARNSFNRALEICKKSLSEGHPTRVSMETNLQRIIEMEQRNEKSSNS